MSTRRKGNRVLTCSLDQVSLYDLDQRIVVDGINEEPSDLPLSQTGGLLLRPEREKLTITIKIRIKEPNLVENELLKQQVNGWAAAGGWLRTNLHERQKIHVQCARLLSSAAPNFESTRELTFVSSGLAYLQDDSVESVSSVANTSAGSLSLAPNGTRTSYLEAEITNAGSDTMTSLQLSANGYTILFQDLSVPAGGKLEIGYDDLHLMYAIVGSTHVLGKRTGQSADHIYLTPMRSNLISYTASHPVSVIFKARGVYE